MSPPSVLPRPRDRRDYDALLIQMIWHTYFKFTPVGQRFGRCVDRFAGVYAANSVNSLQNIIVPSEHAKVSVEVKFHSVIIADTLEGLGYDC